MIVLAGGHVVLPDRVLPGGSVLIDQGRIVGIDARDVEAVAGAEVRPMDGRTLVPGFIDVHVHGVEGIDVLDGPAAVGQVASRLPRYGVTAFCPTSVACAPADLRIFLLAVDAARAAPAPGSARTLPAHLESNFINPAWNGAQPAHCLRRWGGRAHQGADPSSFSGDDIVRVIANSRDAVAIVTLAPELDGGLDLRPPAPEGRAHRLDRP